MSELFPQTKRKEFVSLSTLNFPTQTDSQNYQSSLTSRRKHPDPLYQSSSTKLNYEFIRTTRPTHTKNPMDFILKKSPARPSSKSHLIKKKINSMNKYLTINTEPNEPNNKFTISYEKKKGFRNRPIVNLNRKDLDFKKKNLLGEFSPTNKMVVSARGFYGRTRHEENTKFKLKEYNKNNTNNQVDSNTNRFLDKKIVHTNRNTLEHIKFMEDMSLWTNKIKNEWKK